MLSRLLARLVLAAALLAAWQSSLVHPLQHTDERGGFVHLDDGHGKKSGASELCDALAALTACVSDAPQGTFAPAFAEAPHRSSAAALLAAEPPPFLSQGPPTLL